jgi:N-acyl-D-amino-acid deacylase
MQFDLVLRDGTIFDGSGGDCRGRAIAPGLIDMHSHSDWILPNADHGAVLAPLVEQGITTLVGGNCGCSPAPYLDANRSLLPRLCRMLHDQDLDYGWSGMGEFLGALDTRGIALNLAQLVGHGTLRAAVKGLDPSPATPEDERQMADLARSALDEGAIGLSTGLGYAPGIFASPEELIAVTEPLAERGGVYTSHARSYIALQPDPASARSPIRRRRPRTSSRWTRRRRSTGPTAFRFSTRT